MLFNKLYTFAILVSYYSFIEAAVEQGELERKVPYKDRVTRIKTHSISPPYTDEGLQNRWFDFGGNAIINTNEHIRLTSAKPSLQKGYLWSRLPLAIENFHVEFEYSVTGILNGKSYGDGFAVWLTSQRATVGPVFGSINKFNGIGVFFDTFKNDLKSSQKFPRISLMVGNGKVFYDHNMDGATTELAGCEANFRNRDFPTRARLAYFSNNYLQLFVNTKDGKWFECFKALDVKLPKQAYLGFTAQTTGKLNDNHDIISIISHSMVAIPTEETEGLDQMTLHTNTVALLSKFLVFGIMLSGVVYIGYNKIQSYRERKSYQQKRFY